MRISTRWTALLCCTALGVGCTKSNSSAEHTHDMAVLDQAVSDLAGMSTDLAGASNDLAGGSGDLAVVPDLAVSPVDIGTCTPNAFSYCEADGVTAVYCNAAGTGGVTFDCGVAGCLGPSGCGQCTMDSCASGTFTPCDTTHQKTGAPVACETLSTTGDTMACASATACGPACAGTFVCGNGTLGTAVNSSYTCSAGAIGTGTACAFGCDDMTGKCRDLVPANDGADHLAGNDAFSCTGTQSATLASISGASGDTITFNTGTSTVTKAAGTGPVMLLTNISWGGAYTPANGHTTVITAHIHSLTLTAGAKVTVTGANALILLVDQSVSVAGSVATPTVIDLSAHYSPPTKVTPEMPNISGPGASVGNNKGEGGTGVAANQSGSGGGGYGVAGGKGGDGNAGSTLPAGGVSYGGGFVLEAGGYGGGPGYDNAGKGGGGLRISACGDISLGDNVLVNASGGGGKAGGVSTPTSGGGPLPLPSPSPLGGYGGGAGGTILIEAATMTTLSSELVANGGGGGEAGSLANGVAGPQDGSDWITTSAYNTPAAGGGVLTQPGSGGAGGAGATLPVDGISGKSKNAGGAGGGGYGYVYVAVSPIKTAPTGLTTSPNAVVSKTCVTTNGSKPATCTYP